MSNKTNSLKFQPETLINVEMKIEVLVDLPEGVQLDDRDRLSSESAERAMDAAIALIENKSHVFLDGEDNKPANTYCDIIDIFKAYTWYQSYMITTKEAKYKIVCTDDRIIDVDPFIDKKCIENDS